MILHISSKQQKCTVERDIFTIIEGFTGFISLNEVWLVLHAVVPGITLSFWLLMVRLFADARDH